MFTRIIKTEWRNLFAEKSFLILAVFFAAVLVYGIYNTSSWIAQKSAENQNLIEKQEKDIAEKKEQVAKGYKGSTEPGNYVPDPSDPYTIGMGLYNAVLPFAPSAVFSLGQSDVLESNAGVSVATLQRTKADKKGFENPLSFLAGHFDLSFVMVYLLPLFILALSFNVLSGERENGILQILLSQPLKLKNLLTAKITAQFSLIFLLVLLAVLGGFLISGISLSAEGFWAKAFLWTVVVFAYMLFWFSLAVFINSYGYSSATNAVAAAAVWLILVLVLPSLLNILVSVIYPVPPRTETISAIRGVNLDMRRDGKKLLAEHYQDHPELMPKEGEKAFEDFGLAFVHIQREQKKRVVEVEERFAEQVANQQNLVQKLGLISPSVIAQEAFNEIAGTGLNRYRHFRLQVKEFDRQWTDFFLPRIYKMDSLTAKDFESIPRFEYEEESFSTIGSRVGIGVLILLIMSGVLMFLSFGKLKNYRLE